MTFRDFLCNAKRKGRSAFGLRLPCPNAHRAPPGGLGFVKNSLRNLGKNRGQKIRSRSRDRWLPNCVFARKLAKRSPKVPPRAPQKEPKIHEKQRPLRTAGARTLTFAPPGRFRGTPPLENPRIWVKNVEKRFVQRDTEEMKTQIVHKPSALKTKKCGGMWRSPPGLIILLLILFLRQMIILLITLLIY